MKQEKEQNEF